MKSILRIAGQQRGGRWWSGQFANNRGVQAHPLLTQSRSKSAIVLSIKARVKPGYEGAFKQATLESAKRSVAQETGILRFDLMQSEEVDREFVLFEVFKTKKDILRHQETKHYQVWRNKVDGMMDGTRELNTYTTLFPSFSKWTYPTLGKKQKRKRDPSLPKRPPNAYMLFAKDTREDVKHANPGISPTEVMRELGRRWRETATLEEKARYEADAQARLAEYNREMKAHASESAVG